MKKNNDGTWNAETLEEAACFGKKYLLQWLAVSGFWSVTTKEYLEAVKPEVVEGVHTPTFHRGGFSEDSAPPSYCPGCPRTCGPTVVKANALTIGKTCGEIRDLLVELEKEIKG